MIASSLWVSWIVRRCCCRVRGSRFSDTASDALRVSGHSEWHWQAGPRPGPGRPHGSPRVPTQRDLPFLGDDGPHPDRPSHQRGPMAASAPDNPPADSACPWARHRLARRPRLCANLRKVDSMLLSPASPRRPSGGRHVAISLPWATTRPAHHAGPVAVPAGPVADSADHAGRLPAPGAPFLAHRRPCAFFGRWPPGRIARARAWGESLCNINGPSHRPPPRLYSARGARFQ